MARTACFGDGAADRRHRIAPRLPLLITKIMRYKLKLDNGICLANWEAPWRMDFSFPDILWAEGIMLLNGLPIIVRREVRLLVGGRIAWRKKVPVGAAKRRNQRAKRLEAECCRD